jgi:signal transduction histidine kinase/CheY-like chemotaxis protein
MGNEPSSWDSQRLYRLVFEQSSEATVVVDDDGRMLLANRAARELPFVNVEQLFRWSPNRDPELTSFRAQLRVGSRASCELDIRPSQGPTRRLALEGRAHGPAYVVVLRDVTELRRAARELRHLRRLESTSFLAASIVHDFANVMTAVIGSAGLLSSTPADERTTRLTQELLAAGHRGSDLVRRGLRLLRHKASPPERLSPSTTMADLRGLVELLVGSSVVVKMNLDGGASDVLVDRERLEQALLNLAANARDAMPHGGELTITTSDVTLSERDATAGDGQTGGDYVAITVSDTGEGMTSEVRERIFERFFTTKGAREEGGGGTGLGLATVHAFVTESDGCITVRSAPGAGTTVVMYLPRVAPGRVIPLSRPEPEAPTGQETVLVIEGDDHVRFVVRAVLAELGYFVIDAPSGELALRQVRLASRPVHLVLADVASPGLTGREVSARLTEDGHAPALLWMSGLTEQALAEHGIGEEPLLRKAFKPAELARSVRAVLDPRGGRGSPAGGAGAGGTMSGYPSASTAPASRREAAAPVSSTRSRAGLSFR